VALVGLVAVVLGAMVAAGLGLRQPLATDPAVAVAPVRSPPMPEQPPRPSPSATATGTPTPTTLGAPYGSTVQGLLTFRGNPTRTYYGRGPVPDRPAVRWRYPDQGALCGRSTVGSETTTWCGTGWTGQPAVFERQGRTWVVFGAYDHQVHFLDAATGQQLLPPYPTGDIIKGSVTVDPDGYPLVYTGSRDNRYRVLAIDRDQPVELWALDADQAGPTMWNDDWDGAGLIVDDHLFLGGENSRFHVVRLNRGYDAAGRVTVAPQLVFSAPGWDDELLAGVGDRNVSIENSVTMVGGAGGVVYFANSGGLVQGWDVSGLRDGVQPRRVFRFWTGDDTDATVVADDEGMLYVASEYERGNARALQVGQLLKLDPSRPDDPVVWSVADVDGGVSGFWATPALHGDLVYAPTTGGRLLALDRATGAVRWTKQLPDHTWSSPVVVGDVLLQGDCEGVLHAYDVSRPGVDPPELWTVQVEGCIESTPAVWDGGIYFATRAGQFLAFGPSPQ
jgi:outer membrane protein assembly factor BamB